VVFKVPLFRHRAEALAEAFVVSYNTGVESKEGYLP
jgi:hypothetical protein